MASPPEMISSPIIEGDWTIASAGLLAFVISLLLIVAGPKTLGTMGDSLSEDSCDTW